MTNCTALLILFAYRFELKRNKITESRMKQIGLRTFPVSDAEWWVKLNKMQYYAILSGHSSPFLIRLVQLASYRGKLSQTSQGKQIGDNSIIGLLAPPTFFILFIYYLLRVARHELKFPVTNCLALFDCKMKISFHSFNLQLLVISF